MTLYINTTQNNLVEIALKNKGKFIVVKKFKSDRTQAEKLLPAIEKLLKTNKIKLSNLKGIEVANGGDSFTSLRIGVVTANALAYALNIAVAGDNGKNKIVRSGKRSFKVVNPAYNREPDITEKKSRNF
ncbi:MAG: tRNA (adenosine(37)-N6)-threonylcarbamoyltransferase complex dimerization subunit type 1 TsaB [Patescibacteria group bacterium]|jgi:tRNA threonylcarbamoyl adenosine modification protein YeaZ